MATDAPEGASAQEPASEAREVLPPTPEPRPVRRRGVGPFSLRQVAAVLGVVVVSAIAVTLGTAPLGTTGPQLPNPEASAYVIGSAIPGLRAGDLAPELSGTLGDGTAFQLTDLDGAPIRLADLRGKVVWINFWASWCPPCQAETPILRTLDERYRDRGLKLIAIQVQQTVEAGRDYATRYGLEYTIGSDVSAAVFHAYKVFALPTQFFVDTNGVIQLVLNGPVDEQGAAALIESLLPPSASGG